MHSVDARSSAPNISILQIHLYCIVLFANMDRPKLLLQLLRVLFFEASRHRWTVANIYDEQKLVDQVASYLNGIEHDVGILIARI